MPIVLTADERAELDGISRELAAISTAIAARPKTPLGGRMQEDLELLEGEAPQLVNDSIKADFVWLTGATDDEKRRRKVLAERYNAIIANGRVRGKQQRDSAIAAEVRAQVRAQLCDDCFMIHRPNQKECDV